MMHDATMGMSTKSPVFADMTVNRRNPRVQLLMVLFRMAQRAREPRDRRPRAFAIPIGVLYRFVSEWCLGIEIPWKTRVGQRLTIYHGYGLVINDGSIIGDDVILRQGVTIGALVADGACPSIGDGVEVGASAVILGGISVGTGARIGAGAVVLSDVPAGAVAVGVPARIVSPVGT
ncbi:serine O-acetyltransferase [Microbacterium sp.]|jgi:putative colanic acid biosynthesis acetyltransferase WcaB|uniref:serine O-acetyltransferase n=1 Tax=Microbacterium sp. TaxID=51671 RepID=UPI0037CAF34F